MKSKGFRKTDHVEISQHMRMSPAHLNNCNECGEPLRIGEQIICATVKDRIMWDSDHHWHYHPNCVPEDEWALYVLSGSTLRDLRGNKSSTW